MLSQRQRLAHAKSRKGCLACKARHLKCGEETPSCQRCVKTNRQCDYSSSLSRHKVRGFKITTPSSMYLAKLDSDNEVQAFEYFHCYTLPVLQVCHPSVLWNTTLGFSVQTSPVLRSIAVALGSQQRHFATSTRRFEASDTSYDAQNAVLYGKAIRSARQASTTKSEENTPIIALGCTLLIILESMKGSREDMLLHLKSGVRIVIGRARKASSTCLDELQEVATLLQQFCVSSWMYCTSPAYQGNLALILQSIEFDELADSQFHGSESISRRLHGMISKAIFTVRRLMFPGATRLHRFESFNDLFRLKSDVESLQVMLDSYSVGPPHKTTAQLHFLRAKSNMLWLFIKAILGQKESREETECFLELLDMLESALVHVCAVGNNGKQTFHPPPFSIGTGVLQMLETISRTTVDGKIQHRARHLLQLCPRTEGLWSAQSTTKSLYNQQSMDVDIELPARRFLATKDDERLASTEDVVSAATKMLSNVHITEEANFSG